MRKPHSMRAIGYENKTLYPIIKIKYDNFYEFVDEISFLSFIKELSGIKGNQNASADNDYYRRQTFSKRKHIKANAAVVSGIIFLSLMRTAITPVVIHHHIKIINRPFQFKRYGHFAKLLKIQQAGIFP